MERAFSSPYVLRQRLGHNLDAHEIATFDPEALETLFATPRALHRVPRAFAKRAQEMCQILVERYDGDASKLWTEAANGRSLRRGGLAALGRRHHRRNLAGQGARVKKAMKAAAKSGGQCLLS